MRLTRVPRPPRIIAAVVGVLVMILPAQAAVIAVKAARTRAPLAVPVDLEPRLVDPFAGLRKSASPTPSPPPRPPAPPKPSPTPTKPPPPPGPSLTAFAGLGAWVDVYDFDIDPTEAVAVMKANGVRTLYLQTGRFNTPSDIAPENAAWLAAAHAAGLKVVGWYLPSYKDLALDVRRTVAIARYRAGAERFDALGVDIEWKNDVPNPTWNDRVVQHLMRVRSRIGKDYPVAAIVPPPLQMDVAPRRWAGFPWRGIARNSHLIMLMSYWSFRDCSNVPDHCPYPFTHKNLRETRRLIGNVPMPIHTIGGVGDRITRDEVADFVRGAHAGKAYGASLYDFRTTASSWWPLLEQLTTLGPKA